MQGVDDPARARPPTTGGTGVKQGDRAGRREARHRVVRVQRRDQALGQGGDQGQGLRHARRVVVSRPAPAPLDRKLSGLRKGTLVYKAFAKDKVGNKSATISHKATLTRR